MASAENAPIGQRTKAAVLLYSYRSRFRRRCAQMMLDRSSSGLDNSISTHPRQASRKGESKDE